MRLALLFLFSFLYQEGYTYTPEEIAKWEAQAAGITIVRDNWGIPHIYGKTDADAVFGMLYAQCEDDFARVERNYLDATGQMALAYGKKYIYHDLRARMFMDSLTAIAYYEKSPKWMKKLCDAFADGINFYLYKHPKVKPDYITRFRPWMPFTFSEGSIGGDITRISLKGLEAFYGSDKMSYIDTRWSLEEAPTGSNGFSIAPAKSKTGNALFLINPHTSFYFRSELHVNSEEGLKAYGAVTWGQFFIYQGFNEHCGWMHTSTYADAIDQYEERISKKDDTYFYSYGDKELAVREEQVSIPYTDGDEVKRKAFTLYYTHHGPIVRREGENWISFRMMNRPLDALKQSYLRTKSTGYRSFKKTMKIRTNSSNNTVYADQGGNIAYWHGNFIPKRNPTYDYNGLIDGSNPQTDWKGLHKPNEIIHVLNPASAWIQNCNATPFTVAGKHSPKRSDYANYIAPDKENFRGINAVRVLSKKENFDIEDVKAAANDPYLAAFEKTIPALVAAHKAVGDPSTEILPKAIQKLEKWNLEYGENSVETSLAVYWAEALLPMLYANTTASERRPKMLDELLIDYTTNQEKVAALEKALKKLEEDFGSWQTPWGEINRFQRLTGKIDETFDDTRESIPVGFTSSRWGSLASYGARTYPHTKRRYGLGGNSFVAVVEFGPTVKAQTIVSGGQSNKPGNKHFTDQAAKFCKGEFKEAYYYKNDVMAHQEESYHPGEMRDEK